MKDNRRIPLIICTLLICIMNFLPISGVGYERSPFISEEVWNEYEPYFLPEDMPEKEALDRIFHKKRVLSSIESLRKAGFLIVKKSAKIIVVRHASLRGYLLKVFLDKPGKLAEMGGDEAPWLKRRIDGAKVIQDAINLHGYQNIMKVPKKWLYPLPADPPPKQEENRRNFVLLVEDMHALSVYKNRIAYRERMTPELTLALYTMIKENKLYDSIHPGNVPFCKDGKLAFLDTEYYNFDLLPISYFILSQFLSTGIRDYWQQLVDQGSLNN